MRVTVPKKEWIPRVMVVVALTIVTIVSLLPLFVEGGREAVEVEEPHEETQSGVQTATPVALPKEAPKDDAPVRIPAPPVFAMVTQSLEEEDE